MDRNLIVGVDIGTSKVVAVVGELSPDGQLNVVGAGQQVSKGVDKGGVNDLEAVVNSVQRVVNEAEMMIDCHVKSVYLSISGRHIEYKNERGQQAIASGEVTQDDIDGVIHNARSVKLPEEHRLLHVLPQQFRIDYQEAIRKPLGLAGVRIEADVHLISGHADTVRNLIKCVEQSGLSVDHMIYSGLASSVAVLTEDEKDLGVCVIDMGAGTMDVSIYLGGQLRCSVVVPYAGNTVTSDIAYFFGTPLADAEQLKCRFGSASPSEVSRDDQIEVPSVGGRPPRRLARQTLAEVIEPRCVELFGMVKQHVVRAQEEFNRQSGKQHHHKLAAGVVITGGGARMQGLAACAKRVFDCEVRIAEPARITGLTDKVNGPEYATALGLLKYAATEDHSRWQNDQEQREGVGHWLTKVLRRIKQEF